MKNNGKNGKHEPEKLAKQLPTLIPQPGGKGALLSGGIPGHKGGGGRPLDAWKLACEGLATNVEVLEQAKAILKDKDHPAWLGAWKFVGEQRFGKAPQSVDVTSNGETIKQTIRIGGITIEF